MVKENTFDVVLTQNLSTLSPRHRTAFAACCMERMVENYHAFVLVEKWGNIDHFDASVNQVWNSLAGTGLPMDRCMELQMQSWELSPDAEDFPSIYSSLGLCAVQGVLSALGSCLDDSVEHALVASRSAFDSVDLYLHWVNDPLAGIRTRNLVYEEWMMRTPLVLDDFDKWVATAPLMIAEAKKQTQELMLLRASPDLSIELLARLRQSAATVGVQPLSRGLVKQETR